MAESPDFFRDFGIIPYGVSPPPGRVRAEFSAFRVFGQYLFTAIIGGFGLAIALLCLFVPPLPWNLLAVLFPLALFGPLVYIATRNDYAWVELDGERLRAKHLYTRRIRERSLGEIDDLLTHVFLVRSPATVLAERWLGRVRGVLVRFRDGKTPFFVSRADPKMTNAKELIEAIVYQMSGYGPIDVEVIEFDGAPLVRRIFYAETVS